jgi:hypothetical protein
MNNTWMKQFRPWAFHTCLHYSHWHVFKGLLWHLNEWLRKLYSTSLHPCSGTCQYHSRDMLTALLLNLHLWNENFAHNLRYSVIYCDKLGVVVRTKVCRTESWQRLFIRQHHGVATSFLLCGEVYWCLFFGYMVYSALQCGCLKGGVCVGRATIEGKISLNRLMNIPKMINLF